MGNLEMQMGKFVMPFLILILFELPSLSLSAAAEAGGINIDVDAIAELESGSNALAYNPLEQAYGMHQIRAAALCDYNTAGPGRSRPLVLTDMYDEFLSEHVADWYINRAIPAYLKHFKIPDTIDSRLIAYNMGVGALAARRRIPARTVAYIRMYKELTNTK